MTARVGARQAQLWQEDHAKALTREVEAVLADVQNRSTHRASCSALAQQAQAKMERMQLNRQAHWLRALQSLPVETGSCLPNSLSEKTFAAGKLMSSRHWSNRGSHLLHAHGLISLGQDTRWGRHNCLFVQGGGCYAEAAQAATGIGRAARRYQVTAARKTMGSSSETKVCIAEYAHQPEAVRLPGAP